jgi:hypothetical protein
LPILIDSSVFPTLAYTNFKVWGSEIKVLNPL